MGGRAVRHDLQDLDRRYRSALMSFFSRRLSDRAEAEDLTQEVFAKLAAGHAEDMERPDAYIFQTAANLLRDRARRNQVRSVHLRTTGAVDSAQFDSLDPDRILVGRETLGEVADALRALPTRTRAIFLLFRLENMRQAEIAGLYGISVSAVQKHLLKAVRHLATTMTNGGSR